MKSKCGQREIDNNKHTKPTILKYGEGGIGKICGADMKYEIGLGSDNLQLGRSYIFWYVHCETIIGYNGIPLASN